VDGGGKKRKRVEERKDVEKRTETGSTFSRFGGGCRPPGARPIQRAQQRTEWSRRLDLVLLSVSWQCRVVLLRVLGKIVSWMMVLLRLPPTF
jgi:hypothetical protein